MSTSNPTSDLRNRRGHAGEKTVSEKLARKRSLDRKAQQAARSRTKWTIENLEYQVAHLNNVLVAETTRLQSLIQGANDEVAVLRAENTALKTQLGTASSGHGSIEESSLGQVHVESPTWEIGMISIGAHTPVSVSPYESVPWNTEPTCTSDGILQTYARAARMLVHATSDIFLKEQPDLTSLLAEERSTNPSGGVSSVVSDILLAYNEIDTLPKKAACLYVMYKLLNWLIYRTKLTYDQLPKWLRPMQLQLRVKHAAWIDRIPWPSARIYLIKHPEITFDEFVKYYSSSFHVSWPYEDAYVLVTLPQTTPATEAAFNNWFVPNNHMPGGEALPSNTPILNPVFEQHLRQLKNWSVSNSFRERFPEMSTAMENDSFHDNEDHYAAIDI